MQMRAEAHADVRTPAASAATETPGVVAAERSTLRRVRAAVEELPPRQREVVTLRIIEGMSTRETAETMGCAQGTVFGDLMEKFEEVRLRWTYQI